MSRLATALAVTGDHPAAARSNRGRIETLMDAGMTAHRLAVEIGVPERDVSAWVRGDTVPEIDSRVGTWLKERDAEEPASPPVGFVETPTAKKILTALDEAHTIGCIGLIYGGAGIGKTQCAEQYMREHQGKSFLNSRGNVVYMSASQDMRTPHKVLEELFRSLGCYVTDHNRVSQLNLTRIIQQNLPPNGHLIVDEAQYLIYENNVECLRYFLDNPPHIAITLMGNEDIGAGILGPVHDGLESAGARKTRRKTRFAQLSSRVGVRLAIPHPTAGDVDAILEAHGVSGRDERQFCVTIGTVNGGLRDLGMVLRTARDISATFGQSIDLTILRAAAKRRGKLIG